MEAFFSETYLLPILGFLIGIVGTVVGVGGGFFIVPYLLFTTTDDHPEASGTSLCLVALNALSSTVRNALQGRVEWKLGLILGLATLPGAYLGPILVEGISVSFFQIAFGALLAACAGYMAVLSTMHSKQEGEEGMRHRWGLAIAISVGTGFVAAMFGIGGGIIYVPFLLFVIRIPARDATATSHFALLFGAILGTAVYAFRDHVILEIVMWMGPGVVVGAQVGSWASKRIRTTIIRRAFAVIAILVAAKMILTGFRII